MLENGIKYYFTKLKPRKHKLISNHSNVEWRSNPIIQPTCAE